MLPKIDVQQPASAATVPLGPEWIHEIKHDGYRIVAYIEGGQARLISRQGIDWTLRMKPLAEELARLKIRSAILDGEAAVPDDCGVTRVDEMWRATQRERHRLVYYAFDLLWLNGRDWRLKALLDRKERLRNLIPPQPSRLCFSSHVAGVQGAKLYELAAERGCEGIVSKRSDRAYRGGASKDWVKIKPPEVRQRQAESVAHGAKRTSTTQARESV